MSRPRQETLSRRFGYGAVFLREILDRAVPEAQGTQKAYAQAIERAGAGYPSESKISRWLNGEREADLRGLEKLFAGSKGTQDQAEDIVASLRYLYAYQHGLQVGQRCPEPPPLAREFLDRISGDRTEVVEATVIDDEHGRAHASVSARTQIGNIEVDDRAEIGDVETGPGSSTDISNIKAGTLKIGDVRSGVNPKRS